jgi:hypothetical protein
MGWSQASLLLAHASWVFTIPKRLCPYFMHNRKLLAKLSLCAWEVLSDYLKTSVAANANYEKVGVATSKPLLRKTFKE